MKELNFATGIQEYKINGANGSVVVAFNPTDSNFVEKLFDMFTALDEKQNERKAEVDKEADKKRVFEIGRKYDGEMRKMIDDLFGLPVCDSAFGAENVYALADGLPVWCNFMLIIMDEIDTTFAREQKATNPRIKKYTEKYHRK